METVFILALIVGAVILFISEKYPVDLVAIMILGLLLVSGTVTMEEGLSGFNNPATMTVAAMFVLSAGLQKTGAVRLLGRTLTKLGKSPSMLLFVTMALVGVVSAFVNNTAAVAVLLPLILATCTRHSISPSKLLIPLSFASQFGGVCTLIGTSTNLLVSSMSANAGYGAFTMFEFAPLGLVMLGAGTVYFLTAGRWLLPTRRGAELTEAYELGEYITELRVLQDSPLIGKTVIESKFGEKHDATVLEILRDEKKIWLAHREAIRAGDILLVRGRIKNLMELKSTAKLEIEPQFKLKDAALETEELILVEALVAPRSRLTGRTLADLNFRRRFNAIVLAIQRRDKTLREKLNQVRLAFGDSLLLQLPKVELAKLRRDDNFIMLEEIDEPSMRRGKVPLVLGIFGLVVSLAALGILPILYSAVLGCVAMVVTRCLELDEAYAAIDWKVIFLLAGILPLGIAMEKTGTAQFLVDHTLGAVGGFGPLVVLATLYLLTAVLTSVMSNNASAVLLTPIAISIAGSLNIDPKPLMMAVCFAASTCFATPVGYQTNTMVYHPGGYRFTDFMKVGIPLNIIFWLLSIWLIPKFWPF